MHRRYYQNKVERSMKIKAIIFGATGMAGEGVLLEGNLCKNE
jgi:hypothetical protein